MTWKLPCYNILYLFLYDWYYPMGTSSSIRHRFDGEIPRGKFVKITSILKGESTWKLWHLLELWHLLHLKIMTSDSTWIFRRGFDFQNRRNIDKFSTWIFLCRFDVKSTQLLHSLFPFYHFLVFSTLGTYSKLFWYNVESL